MELGLTLLVLSGVGFLTAYLLGFRSSEKKIFKAWLKKGVEVEKNREKIREKYMRLRESVRPSVVFRRAVKGSKTNKAGDSGKTDS